MFVDRVKIHIKGGNGGNGMVSFFRAKYITHGGPDGGDGGRGGDVIFVGDESMGTLMDFRYKRIFKAGNGQDGGKRNCFGKDGESITIKVPVGTVIREAESGKIMADITKHGEEKILIHGGKGGKGNQHFATPTRQAPRYAEQGRVAKEYDVILELKLIADVGLIGFPNVGKSTLLSMVTNANPKIANYHFTTLSPNLGVVEGRYGDSFVLADIPGLVEGASEGVGLGHEFLRHVERTKVFIHVVDAAGVEGDDPVENVRKINQELEAYNPELLKRPQVIAANKTDIPGSEENVERLKAAYENEGFAVYPISAATNTGLDELLTKVAEILKNYPEDIVFEEEYEEYDEVAVDQEPFTIDIEDGVYVVKGVGVEKMIGYTNIDTEKGFAFFQRYLKEKGIIEALEEKGIGEGDTVRIYDMEFEFWK
ncbi:GTPase ObgE [Anaerotignum lactatifermentans]|uniref:GTPase Obg n=1 Tax=Anaerotignum lactatifermentans TaxID=160404 RepID=A0ABS2G6P2_9FIRM|nr:GTPase ObgE [Anaerotignum lactatifermentans]MBM6828805.1 GTPase ObgE [Anaerotignum lactatifermentans]MBM6877131.1 GTPase ObgE [Anaerotignum lactatifermentans]MBM6950386.1 GTPase ObgE [Anaerotignum lactatifermentans]